MVTFSLFQVTLPISDFFLFIIFKIINNFIFYGPRIVLGAKDAKMIKTWSIFLRLSQPNGEKSTKNHYNIGQK